MNTEQFAMWVQGMLEYRTIEGIDGDEAKKMLQGIKDHVALVFTKVTPEAPKEEPKKNRPIDWSKLNEAFKSSGREIPGTPPFKPGIIKPDNITISPPYPNYPWPVVPRPFDYDRPNYWLSDRPLPGIYC